MIALVLITLLSLALTASMKRFQFEQLSTKDERLSKIVEAVSYLKIIKLHVWEEPFQAQVQDIDNTKML
jgi:ABC-type bacteriocin/lantibiotic exporter with double-glycine peptidase domain